MSRFFRFFSLEEMLLTFYSHSSMSTAQTKSNFTVSSFYKCSLLQLYTHERTRSIFILNYWMTPFKLRSQDNWIVCFNIAERRWVLVLCFQNEIDVKFKLRTVLLLWMFLSIVQLANYFVEKYLDQTLAIPSYYSYKWTTEYLTGTSLHPRPKAHAHVPTPLPQRNTQTRTQKIIHKFPTSPIW